MTLASLPLQTEFTKADQDGDGTLSFDEFTSYYNAMERLKEVNRAPSGALSSLQAVFMDFANYGGGQGNRTDLMDGAKWAKFCRETGLQNKKSFTSVQVDLVFSKVKAKGERKIDFEEFKDAISMVAEMKGLTFDGLCKKITEKGGPQSSGTKAEYNKFADPKTFTGAYAAMVGLAVRQRAKADPTWKDKLEDVRPTASLREAFKAFCSFGKGNPDQMEGKTWAKMMRDCNIFDKKFTPTSADIIFSKAKPKGERVIRIQDFCKALQLVAQEKGLAYEEIVQKITSAGGPSSSGTKADSVKFHDDKSMYTGAYAANVGASKDAKVRTDWKSTRERPVAPKGLKSVFNAFCTFGGGSVGMMDNAKFAKCCTDCGILDRKFTSTDADIIFMKVKAKNERKIYFEDFLWALLLISEAKNKAFDIIADMIISSGGPASSGTIADAVKFFDDKSLYTGAYAANVGVEKEVKERKHWKDGRIPPRAVQGLRESYGAFCSFASGDGENINIKIWAKLVTDTGIIDRKFNMTSADIIFSKVAEGARSLNFTDFLWMLDLVAEQKGQQYNAVAQQVASANPSSSGTVADYNKFHDDKSMYTGAYAANVGLASKVKETKHWKDGRTTPPRVDGMETVFDAFCSFAGGKPGAMGVATWNKLLTDAGLYDRRLTNSAADIIFSKVCGAGNKTVGFVDFKWLLALAAEEKGYSYDEVVNLVIACEGPASSGTKADAVKFHDDKSMYTGMHKGK